MEMANPDKRAEYQVNEEQEAYVETQEASDPNHPKCPRCGWHNTRLSYTRSVLDSVLRAFSVRAFRCRSCGNRFHKIRRVTRH
jgi:hypothetical protein